MVQGKLLYAYMCALWVLYIMCVHFVCYSIGYWGMSSVWMCVCVCEADAIAGGLPYLSK